MALERVIFSGFGGQGLMFIGKLFTNIMLKHFAHVSFFPSYGAEVRGGTAHCHVILSSDKIASPIVEEAESLLLMNQPSVDRFLPLLGEHGTAFVNGSVAAVPNGTNARVIQAFELAELAGDSRAANAVLLGAYLRHKGVINLDEARAGTAAFSSAKGKQAEEINVRALTAGWETA